MQGLNFYKMKKYFKYLIFLFAIGLVSGFFIYNKPHQNIEKAKVDQSLTASKLFTEFEVDENAANQIYLDKIVEITGVVREVSADENGMTSLTLNTDNEMFGVICQLDNLTKHKRTDFKKGEEITLKGICTGVLMDVVLVRCVES